MHSLRELPPVEKRVETGPTQFGDDWPGVFIRGDDCLGYSLYLELILNGAPLDDVLVKSTINGLLGLLRSSRV